MLSPAMATMLAVLTTDAAVEPGRLGEALRAGGRRHVRLPERRRLPVDQRHGDRARQRCAAGAGRRPRALVAALTEVCGSLAEQMARDAEGATKLVRVRGASAPAPRPKRGSRRAPVANSQLVQCSLNGGDAYWGRVLSELRCERRVHRSRAGRHRLQRRDRVPRRRRVRARRGRARRAHGRPRDRDRVRSAPVVRRGDGAHDRSVARLHRREPADLVTTSCNERVATGGREGGRARRGAAVHPRVLRQDRRDQVRRPRDERSARSPICSPPTSCSCASSA